MRTRPLRAAAWLPALAAFAVLWAQVVPFPRGGRLDVQVPFTQLSAVRPALTLLAVVLGVAWSLAAWRLGRTRAPAVVLLVVAVAAAAQIAPRALSSSGPAAGDGPALTVLTANLLRSTVAPGALVDLVRRTHADVLTLPETNAFRARQIARALTVARGERWRAETDRSTPSPAAASAAPTSMVVREALGPVRLREPARDPRAHGQVRVRLTRVAVGGGPGPRIAAVHPLPPWPAGSSQQDWRRDLRALRVLCRGGWVLGGDLNATIDHSPLRSVLGAGCADASAQQGQGLRATWTGGVLGAVRPAIDHVLTSGAWRTTAAGVLPIAGSDHRAVWARIVRRPGR